MLEGDLEAVPPHLLAEVHNAVAFAASLGPDLPGAVSHADEAVKLSRAGGSSRGLVIALWTRAQAAVAVGDLDAMRRYALEALETSQRQGDRWGRAGPLTALGMASLFGGSLEEARGCFEEALPLYRELGDRGSLVIMTLGPLTAVALGQKDLGGAERYATEALAVADGTAWEATALVFYGEVLAELGDAEAAEAAAVRALQVALDSGLENWFRIALRDLARAAAEQRRYEDAVMLLAASRHGVPFYGLDPSVYGPIEERCREELGPGRFDQLAAQGEVMTHEELMDRVGAGQLRTVPSAGSDARPASR